jgi:hypothetical protein
MGLEIIGVICQISPVHVITPSFRKRDFVLDISYEYQDITIESYATMQALNGICNFLDDKGDAETLRFIVGDKVKCFFKLKGIKGKGNGIYYNNLNVYKIEAVKQEYEVHTPIPAPVSREQQIENFEAQEKNGQGFVYGNMPIVPIDDLPF